MSSLSPNIKNIITSINTITVPCNDITCKEEYHCINNKLMACVNNCLNTCNMEEIETRLASDVGGIIHRNVLIGSFDLNSVNFPDCNLDVVRNFISKNKRIKYSSEFYIKLQLDNRIDTSSLPFVKQLYYNVRLMRM